MNAFGGMFAGYQDPYRMAAGLPDPAGAMGMHAHHAHHMQHVHHGYKVPRIYFKIPRVLPFKEQKEKYETDDYFKKLARESEARYTGFRDRPLHERQAKFQQACREGQIELAILSNGFTFCLMWNVLENGYLDPHAMTRIDFSKERGRVYIDSPIILNGVCLRWKGYINLEKLDGVGGMKFDEDSSRVEDAIMQQQVESYKHAIRDWDEQQQRHRVALQQARASQLAATTPTEEQQQSQQHTATTA
jgi:hypothetical protein